MIDGVSLLPAASTRVVLDRERFAQARRGARLALLAILAGCSFPHSERGVPLTVTASARDGGVVLSADRGFGSVACSYRAAAQPVDSAKSYRTVWWAQCPDDAHCISAVRYGDSSRLVTNDGPTPLAPGLCYTCLLDGDDGAGDVSFTVAADGSVSRCDPNAAP